MAEENDESPVEESPRQGKSEGKPLVFISP
jgi:hypothetical protein